MFETASFRPHSRFKERSVSDLLDQFVSQECTGHVRHLLLIAIAEVAMELPHFEFNRFSITIERDHANVVVRDVLDSSESGVENVALARFVAALDRCSAHKR
jgi:hypothetical protein